MMAYSKQFSCRSGASDSRTLRSSYEMSIIELRDDGLCSFGRFMGRMSVLLRLLRQSYGGALCILIIKLVNVNKNYSALCPYTLTMNSSHYHKYKFRQGFQTKNRAQHSLALSSQQLLFNFWIIQMINQFSIIERLQTLNKDIQRQLDLWQQLDKNSLALEINCRIQQLTEIERDLRAYPSAMTSESIIQIESLRSMLQNLLIDHGIPARPQTKSRSKQHGAGAFKNFRANYQDHQGMYLTALQSPRDKKLSDVERAMKYKRKYCCLKVQFNELTSIANRMEQQIIFLEEQLLKTKKECDSHTKKLKQVQSENDILQKELSLLKADNLSKQFLSKQLKKELEKKQSHYLDKNYIQQKMRKYEQIISQMKIQYEDESSRIMDRCQSIKEKYDVLLNEHTALKDLNDRMNKKYIELLTEHDRKIKDSTEKGDCERYIKSLQEQVSLLKKQVAIFQQRQKDKLKSFDMINNRVQNERKLNKQLEKQLTASRNEKQQLIQQLEQQRTLAKNMEDIVGVVNTLERQNRELRTKLNSNLTRCGKSESKLRVIGQLQNMVKLHKMHMKSSRML